MSERKKTGADSGKNRTGGAYGQVNQRSKKKNAPSNGNASRPPQNRAGNAQNRTNNGQNRTSNTQNRRNTPPIQQNPTQNRQNPVRQTPNGRNSTSRGGQNIRRNGQNRLSREEQSRIVRSQTSAQQPKNRRMERDSRKLNPHQIEIRRRREAAQRFYIKKKRLSSVRLFFSRFFVFCSMFIMLFALCVGLFFLNLFSNNGADRKNIIYRIGVEDGEDTVEHVIPRSSICFGGVNYVDFTELARLFDFVITGDVDELKFITTIKNESGDDQYGENVKFYVGTSLVEINGNTVRLSEKVINVGETVYVPADFISDYVSGLGVVWDSDSRILQITRETDANGKYLDVGFTLKETNPATHIAESDLDESTRYLTDPVRLAEEKRLAEQKEETAESTEGEAATADTVSTN